MGEEGCPVIRSGERGERRRERRRVAASRIREVNKRTSDSYAHTNRFGITYICAWHWEVLD